MSEHPQAEVLERFLLGQLPPGEAGSVVAHLLSGCTTCLAAAGDFGRWLQDLERTSGEVPMGAELTPEELAVPASSLSIYDGAIDRALAAVRLHGDKALVRKAKVKRVLESMTRNDLRHVSVRMQGRYPVYEAALARAHTLRHEDPRQMVFFSWYAVRASLGLEEEGFTPRQAADFQARALGELANALRVDERFAEAERNLKIAFEWARVGTGDPAIDARLLKIRASLLGTQHHYWEAIRLLERVYSSYCRLGDLHEAGRALITKGVYTGYIEDAGTAIELIRRGATLIDESRDPRLKAVAFENQLWLMVGGGLFEEARKLLDQHRSLFTSLGTMDQHKLRWLEGRLLAGLGSLDLSELLLREAAEGFASLENHGHAAMASLDLAVILMHRNAADEACRLAEEAFLVFRSLKVNDAQGEALIVLREALEQRIVTAGFLQSLVDFLRRAEHDPYARYEPRFA